MDIFYIDTILSEREQADVLEQLEEFGEDTHSGLEFKHIPIPLPVDHTKSRNMIRMVHYFRSQLLRAGVPTDRKTVFVMPLVDDCWTTLLQMAFNEVSGYMPYVVQPWLGNYNSSLVMRCLYANVTNPGNSSC